MTGYINSDREEADKEANTTTVGVDLDELKRALQANPEVFIHFFLQDKLTVPVPAFHIEMFQLITSLSVEKYALAVPRGHAKTTVVKIAIIYYFLFTDTRFVCYVSNTATVAKDECRDIIEFIKTANFVAAFGKVEWIKEDSSNGLFIFQLGDKRCILRALGAGQQVRGLNIDNQRPQLFVCDDAEDDENSETPAQRAKLRKWVYGPLFKAGAARSKKIWIGNLISPFCLINDFCDSEFWASTKYGCILANGQPLWPEMFTLEYLRRDFLEYQAAGQIAKWFAEMMNMPVPEGMGLITAEQITYRSARVSADVKYGFITIDPAISNKTWADSCAIVAHGFIQETREWQVLEYVHEKGIDPIRMINMTIDLCFRWRIGCIGIEAVGYQAALKPFFEYVFMQRHLFGIQVFELNAHAANKTARIVTWASWLKERNYSLTQGDLQVTNQLLNYDPKRKTNVDDLIDACALGPEMITDHLNAILAGMTFVDIEAEPAHKICGV